MSVPFVTSQLCVLSTHFLKKNGEKNGARKRQQGQQIQHRREPETEKSIKGSRQNPGHVDMSDCVRGHSHRSVGKLVCRDISTRHQEEFSWLLDWNTLLTRIPSSLILQ